MTKTKPAHKAFSAPFYKLLGGCLLALAVVFGGMVWANYPGIQYCVLNPTLCTGLTPKGTNEYSERTTPRLQPKNNRGSVNTGSALYNKRLQITNESNEAHFVPLRTEAEIVSFLKARSGSLNGKLTVCSPDGTFTVGGENVSACATNGQCKATTIAEPYSCSSGTPINQSNANGYYNWQCATVMSSEAETSHKSKYPRVSTY